MRMGVSYPTHFLVNLMRLLKKRLLFLSEGGKGRHQELYFLLRGMGDIKGHRVGTVAVIYDHTKRGLSNALADIQHHYSHLIKLRTHPPDHDNCFEVVVLMVMARKSKNRRSHYVTKGVKFSKLTIASNEKI